MSRAKVCNLTTVHSPFDARIFHKQAKTLVQAGYEVTLIAQHDQDEIVDGIRIVALPKPHNRFRRIFGLTWRILPLALRQRADIYHLHDPELLPIGMLLKGCTRAKVIYDVREDFRELILVKYWLPKPIRKVVAKFVGLVEAVGARFLDAMVVVDEAIHARFPSGKAVLVKNYPHLQLACDAARTRRPSTAITLIYVGGLNRDRGIYEMLEALGHLDQRLGVRLTLVGKFDHPETEKAVCALPIFKRVNWVGWVPHPQVYDFLHSADIGLVCLHPIGGYPLRLPVKLFEYMAAGLPAIASNFPLWEEIVANSRCGLTVDPGRPEEIARAIEYFIENPKIRKEMGENGRQAVQDRYNWERESHQLLALYTELGPKEQQQHG